MIAKAGLIVAAALIAVIGGRALDLRGLYDQMYPVSTLKRDVLNLCVESDPAFIRALHGQRQACYMRMPHTIAVALGLVRPDNALEALFSPLNQVPGGALLSEAGLGSWAAAFRPTPRVSLPCRADGPDDLAELPAAIAPTKRTVVLAGRPTGRQAKALEALGLAPRAPTLTVLPAPGTAAGPAEPRTAGAPPPRSLIPLDTEAASDLGDNPQDSAGCSTRI